MGAAIFNALKFVPAGTAVKMLGKFDPRFKSYFAKVAADGLDINRAIDYVQQKFGNQNSQQNEDQLERGSQQGTLRPDEEISRQEIQRSRTPTNVLKNAVGFGTAAALGGQTQSPQESPPQVQGDQNPLAGRASPEQNPSFNAEISPQGLQQQNPQQQMVQSAQQAPERLKNAIQSNQREQMQAPETAFEIFLKQNPDLGKYITNEMSKGKDAKSVALSAKSKKMFRFPIEQIEKKVGMTLPELMEYLLGDKASQPQVQQQQQRDFSGLANDIRQGLDLLKNRRSMRQ
jgi:hypothetical protein